MRIALVSPYRLTVPGGVQQQVLGLASALVDLDEDVLVIAPGRPGELEDRGWRFVPVGRSIGVPANGSRAPVAISPQAIWKTRRALRAFAPDVVHVHEPFVPGPALAATLTAVAPVIATFHRAGAGTWYRALRPILGPIAGDIQRLVAVSPAAAATLAAVARGCAEPFLLGNAVDPARFGRPPEAKGDRPGPVICFVGRHELRKGLVTLLLAVHLLGRDVQVRIVGDGPARARLQSRFQHLPGVTWLGAVDDDAVAAELIGADLFIAPSLGGESFGLVLLEAMAAGTAVVASDLPPYRLVADDAAILVPPGDPEALAQAMARLLDDPVLRQWHVDAGLARVKTSTFSALAAAYRSHYRAMAPEPAA
ncbi:MAG TPA: glycosyltransferase family 4 protein [Acidimicrobiales bacterium]|jgi:phosphatidylinositol alpha-mannosyltransferase